MGKIERWGKGDSDHGPHLQNTERGDISSEEMWGVIAFFNEGEESMFIDVTNYLEEKYKYLM